MKMDRLPRALFIPFMEAAKNLMDDSSDEENIDIIEKIAYYAELTVPNMSDRQFQMNFRMTARTFEDLLHRVNVVFNEMESTQAGYPRTALEKELMLTVWYLSNTECFR